MFRPPRHPSSGLIRGPRGAPQHAFRGCSLARMVLQAARRHLVPLSKAALACCGGGHSLDGKTIAVKSGAKSSLSFVASVLSLHATKIPRQPPSHHDVPTSRLRHQAAAGFPIIALPPTARPKRPPRRPRTQQASVQIDKAPGIKETRTDPARTTYRSVHHSLLLTPSDNPPSEQSTCRSLRIRPSSTCRNRPRDQTPPPRHRESSPPPLSLDPFGTPLNTSSPLQGHPDQHNHLPLGPLHHRHQRRPPGPSPRPSCHHLPRRSPAHPLLDQPRSRTRRPHQPPDRSLQRLGPPQHHRLPL